MDGYIQHLVKPTQNSLISGQKGGVVSQLSDFVGKCSGFVTHLFRHFGQFRRKLPKVVDSLPNIAAKYPAIRSNYDRKIARPAQIFPRPGRERGSMSKLQFVDQNVLISYSQKARFYVGNL
jgi:hypothetical protein